MVHRKLKEGGISIVKMQQRFHYLMKMVIRFDHKKARYRGIGVELETRLRSGVRCKWEVNKSVTTICSLFFQEYEGKEVKIELRWHFSPNSNNLKHLERNF